MPTGGGLERSTAVTIRALARLTVSRPPHSLGYGCFGAIGMRNLFSGRRIAAAFAFALFAGLPGVALAQAVLDDTSLQQMLDGLGYAPKALSNGYLITVENEGWTMYIQVLLSSDHTKLGMNANLGSVDESTVTADQWKGLLAANNDIDPEGFVYNADTKKLYMHLSLDNRDMTPQTMREQIDNFMGRIRSTESLWSFTK